MVWSRGQVQFALSILALRLVEVMQTIFTIL